MVLTPQYRVRLVRYTLAPGTRSVTARVKLSQFDGRYAILPVHRCLRLLGGEMSHADAHRRGNTSQHGHPECEDDSQYREVRYGWALMDGTAQDIQWD